MSQQNALADRFRRMHHNGVLILANAWDAGSARVLEAAGSTAIATTSAGVAWSLGYPDGEQITAADLAGVVARMCRVVSVPVTADIEAGYGSSPDEVAATVAAIIDAGAVGINLEDATPDGTLFSQEQQRERIIAAREAADAAGIDLVINARTDIYLRGIGEPGDRFTHTVERTNSYRAAGADCLFVPGVRDIVTIAALVESINGPLNIMAGPGSPPVQQLEELGVARISLAVNVALAAYSAGRRVARETLEQGTYTSMDGGLTFPEMNTLLDRAAVAT